MRTGTLISGILHGLLLAYLYFGLPSMLGDPDDLPQVIVPVELLTIDDITNVMAQTDEPEPEEEPEEEPPADEPEEQVVMKEPEPEPEPEPEVEEEEPEIIPAEDDEVAPEPEEEPEPEEVAEAPAPRPLPNVRPQRKPKPPEKEFSFDDITALLDKLPEEEQVRNPQEVPNEARPQAEEPRRGVGLQTGMTMTIRDAFQSQVQRCWNVVALLGAPEGTITSFRVKLNRDGTLAEQPEFIRDWSVNTAGNPFYLRAAETAQRAIISCQPYNLPQDGYSGPEGWNEFIANFDPSFMQGR